MTTNGKKMSVNAYQTIGKKEIIIKKKRSQSVLFAGVDRRKGANE